MRWEDQELHYASAEFAFPEVTHAAFELYALAEKKERKWLHVDQRALEDWVTSGRFSEKTRGVQIGRLCLYLRLHCRMPAPGGEPSSPLGVMQYWADRRCVYALLHFSPRNDSLEIMAIEAEKPNQLPVPMSPSGRHGTS